MSGMDPLQDLDAYLAEPESVAAVSDVARLQDAELGTEPPRHDHALASDLGRWEPTPYDLGVSNDPDATWDRDIADAMAANEHGTLSDLGLPLEQEQGMEP